MTQVTEIGALFVYRNYMTQILIPQFTQLSIRQEGTRVIVLHNGKALMDLAWEAAKQLSRAILVKALLAEEEAKAWDIIADQAILARTGAPFGLTNNPAMLHEAGKEAAWNSDLRRYIRGKRAGGIESQGVVGTPAIIRLNPK